MKKFTKFVVAAAFTLSLALAVINTAMIQVDMNDESTFATIQQHMPKIPPKPPKDNDTEA